jgi:hypothetical protein
VDGVLGRAHYVVVADNDPESIDTDDFDTYTFRFHDRAVEWARMGTNDDQGADVVSLDVARRAEKTRVSRALSEAR